MYSPGAMSRAPNDHARTIALVGMMGAGKSTVGRLLAERLDLPFRDSDTEVERRAARPVRAIFAEAGEAAFRRLERSVVGELAGIRGVLALGGGAFADANTRALLRRHAVTIWLDASAATLAARLAQAIDRPLLDGSDLMGRVEALLAARRDAYAEADHQIATDAITCAQVVEAILARL